LRYIFHGGIGGGDVKLMTGIRRGAWLRIKKTFMVFTAASIMTGVYAIVALIATGRLINALFNAYP
jgi:Flp pilus assembly protein protease CpaA